MIKKIFLLIALCACIIFSLYWLKHRGNEPSLTSPVTLSPKEKPAQPHQRIIPSKTKRDEPSLASTPKPKKIIHIDRSYDITSTDGAIPLPTEDPRWIFDETGSGIPRPPPTPIFEPSSTGFPGYSTTTTQESWQVYRAVIIRSASLKEDWEKAKSVIEDNGCKIIFQTEKPIHQLRTYVPFDRWEDFKSSLSSASWEYSIEPSADVETLAPDQSIGVSLTLQKKSEKKTP